MFCILDIESSGGPFGKEAIIELAAFRYDGDEVQDQLISLIHPHRDVHPYVQKITGITDKMLIRAPRFHEIAKRLVEITEDCILVGHNVSFDYRMLRQEFSRLGYAFERKTLDTIKLSEELIPGLESYGLEKVSKALGIYNSQVHRAEGDARATLELFKILQEKDQAKRIDVLGQSVVEKSYKEDKISDLLRGIKKNKGLYYVHNPEGQLLYMGMSDNIKGELHTLLTAQDDLAEKLVSQIHSVKTESPGNLFLTKVKYTEERRAVKPRMMDKYAVEFSHGMYWVTKGKRKQLWVKPLSEMGRQRPLFKLESYSKGLKIARMFSRYYREEERDGILSMLRKLPDQAIFTGKGRKHGERAAVVIQDAQLLGYQYFTLNDQLKRSEVLQKGLVPISAKKEALQWLKQSIASGDLELWPAPDNGA